MGQEASVLEICEHAITFLSSALGYSKVESVNARCQVISMAYSI